MLQLSGVPDSLLEVVRDVVSEVHVRAPGLDPSNIMVVGAACRDILHAALGHSFATVATRDLDLGLALPNWDVFEELAGEFPKAGDTGIRYKIAGWPVDLLPFGEVEDPDGVVKPPSRRESISVWAFEEIFAASTALELSKSLQIRIPDVAGYGAAKLGAWLDRSAWGETKDAADLALAAHWYAESGDVQQRLYDTEIGNTILMDEEMDVERAATHLLGADIVHTIGWKRSGELLDRWPGDVDLLARSFRLGGGPPILRRSELVPRQAELVDALTRGLVETGA
jgi:predicted nucleotidyltransferase